MSLGSDASETISMAGEQLTYNNGAAEGAPPVAVKVKGKPGPKPKLKPGPKPKGKPGPKPKMKPGPKPKLKPGPKPKLKPGPKPKGKPGPKPKDPLKLKSGGVGKRSGEQHLREASSSQYPVDSEGHMAHDIATRPLTSQRVEDLVVFTLAVNTYVHTMQAERGASTAYVGGQGNVLARLLVELRSESDDALRRLKETRMFPDVAAEFDKASIVADFRKKVDFLQMDYLEVMAAFNMLIESIIESVCRVVVPLHQINVGMAIGSFVAFMFLKDKVGVERATVGGLLSDARSNKALTESTHLALVANLGSQKAFVRSFISGGISEEIRTEFIMLHMDIPPEIGELERELVISRESATRCLKHLSTEEWFRMMSSRMNALAAIQKKLATEIRDVALKYCASCPPPQPVCSGEVAMNDEDRVFEVLSRIESEDLMLPLDWTLRIGDQTKA